MFTRSSRAFAAFFPAECVFEVYEIAWMAGNQVDADHVEANGRRFPLRQLPEVVRSQAAQCVTLVSIDGGLGRRHVLSGSRFDFDKAKDGTVPCDEIDVARAVARRPPSRDHNVSLFAEEKEHRVFTLKTCGQVGGDAGSSATAGNCIKPGQGCLEPAGARVDGLFHGTTIVSPAAANRKWLPCSWPK